MASERSTAELPVLHRIAIIYLMLPVAIWLLGYFHWWFGIPATALLVAGIWRALGGSWRVAPKPTTFLLLLMALGWVMTTAAGGLLDVSCGDWNKHRGVLTDLARYSWPVHLPDPLVAFMLPEVQAPDALLRYYLGYYMAPGLMGRWFGPAALSWAVPLWTWGGVALIVLLFTQRFTRSRAAIVAALILMGFSGMDFLRILLLSGEAVPLFSSSHIESDDFLLYRIQYSSNASALMWTPQHFIAAGLYSMLLLQLRSQPRFLACSGVLLAACLFWSPFAAVGLLPFLAVLVLDNGARPFLRWQNFLLAGPLAGLLVAFLTSDSADIVQGWLWQKSAWGELAQWLPVFYLTEFLVLSLLLWRCQPQLLRERFFVASVLTLLILPVYTFGYFNDLGMRGSLPALMVLCWYCAEVVSKQLPGGAKALSAKQGGRSAKRRKRPVVRSAAKKRAVRASIETRQKRTRFAFLFLVIAALVVGAITPLHEWVRAYENAGTFRYERMLTSISTNTPRPGWTQFVADEVPAAMRSLLRPHDESADGRWELVIRSNFDVYRNGKILAYTKTPCTEEDLAPYFFLNLWPRHAPDLPEHRRQRGYETLLYADARLYALWQGEKCALIRKLPEYEIERVVTGQIHGGRRVWDGTFSPNLP